MLATILPFPTPATPRTPAILPSTTASTQTATVLQLDALPRAASLRTLMTAPPTAGSTAAGPIPVRATGRRTAAPLAQTPYAGSDRRALRPAPAHRPATPALDRPAQRTPAVSPPAGQDRLSVSLDSLRAALAQQSAAVAAWRASLSELHGAATSLHAGLTLHQTAMHALGERVAQLGTVSAALPDSFAPGRTASA
jgi:hypothetical protein